MARDRPSPYGEGMAFFIGARGTGPAISIVTMCVSPSVVCDRLITTGQDQAILTYRAWRASDGEGQALALR